MKLLFLTDNFPPEVNAPATRTYEHCREWARAGIDVTVITCAPNFPQGKVYPGYRNQLIRREIMDGIKVIRVWSYISANEGFLKRGLDYFSFAVSAVLAGLFVKTDLIVATSPQFFTAAGGWWLSVLKRTPWVMEVRDLWPESIKNLGAVKSGLILRFFEWCEKHLYKKAHKIVVVTAAFKPFITAKRIPENKIHLVPNGANRELYTPRPKNPLLLARLGLSHKLVVSYIGTHGLAHRLDFILRCAERIRDPHIHFLFIGAGAEKTKLLKLKKALSLGNVTMLDPVAKAEVPEYLGLSDLVLINLSRSPIFKTVIPSKIFETAAMQIPILLGAEGESRALIEKHKAGLCYEPENAMDFLDKLGILANDPDVYARCRQGCRQLAQDYDRKVLAEKMLNILLSIPQGSC